jgi:hypothetical protein
VAIRSEQGEPLEKIHATLGRAEIAKTKAYLRNILENPVYIDWVEGYIPDAEPETYKRVRGGGKAKHGLYSKYLLNDYFSAEQIRSLNIFEQEVVRLRVVMARAEKLYQAGRREEDLNLSRMDTIRIILVQMEAIYRIARMKIKADRVGIIIKPGKPSQWH